MISNGGRAVLRRMTRVAPLPAWGLLAAVYAAALAINAFRWHYGPDTRFYLAWAYRFGGLSDVEAGQRTYGFLNNFDWFGPYCWPACDLTDPALTFDWLFGGEQGGLVAQRPVYPLLSAPFVALLGPRGLLVVPAFAYTACVVLTVVLAGRLLGRRWAVPAGIASVLPISIVQFGLYAYTEALAMALLLACVLCLPLARSADRRGLIAFGALLALLAFTRQFHYALVLGVVAAWLGTARRRRGWRNEWLPFVAVGVGISAVLAVVQRLMAPGYSLLEPFLKVSGAQTVEAIPGVLPGVVGRIVVGELHVAAQDFGLVLVVLLGVAGMVRYRASAFTWLTVGLLVGIFALQLVTALPSDNRYWALAVPLLAIHATAFVARVLAPDTPPFPPHHLGVGEVSQAPTTVRSPQSRRGE